MTRAAIFYGASALGCSEATPEAPPAPTETVIAPPPETTVDRAAAEAVPDTPLPVPTIEPDTEEEARAERADAEERKVRARRVTMPPPPPPPCCPPYGAPPFDFVV